MQYEIIYKRVKHGYVRINREWVLQITIPKLLQHNQKFKNELIQKAEVLWDRYQKKQKLHTRDEEFVTLFGEKIPRQEIFGAKRYSNATENKKLKKILLEYVTEFCDLYAEQLGSSYKNITIRQLKAKRWSCSHDQRIVFSLQLLHLPTKFIQYVVAHEICHLKVKNHSAQFRQEVSKIYPSYKDIRKQMRDFVL